MFFDMNAPSPHVPIAQKLARNLRKSWPGIAGKASCNRCGRLPRRRNLTRCAGYHLKHVDTIFKRVFGEA
jgi:hypothetical protein